MKARAKQKTTGRKAGSRKARTEAGASKLPWADRLDIIDALSQVLFGVYVHLPLKRSLYGFDVVRGLEHLRQQSTMMSDLQFHREMTTLINHLRDAHTQYQGRPLTEKGVVASLPFLVEAIGPADSPTYVVSKVDETVRNPHFVEGVTITHWNGIPFDRAVDMHAEVETGGRPDSRRARALESLTFRSLDYAPPPDEEWVILGFTDKKGRPREIRLQWDDLEPGEAPTADKKTLGTRLRRSINLGAEAVRRAKKYRFNRKLWKNERKAIVKGSKKARVAAKFADVLRAHDVPTKRGRFGYLRIWSFDVDDDQAFVEAVISLIGGLSDRGLIIDLRDNPGGFIWAAERLLQLFTPNAIVPTKFALRATPTTAEMARAVFNQSELSPWAESLNTAMITGEPYSSHLPITSVEQCNDMGQHYGGPVVVVVDANTYSSGDLFTAGVVDNRMGPVVCIGEATGAGGANVWTSDDLADAIRATEMPHFQLPVGVSFTLAVRRAVRSGDADGTLIEDAGVVGQRYDMTSDDVFKSNVDLIEHCGEILSAQPFTRLKVVRSKGILTVETKGLDQLDIYLNGHPAGAPIILKKDGKQRLPLRAGKHEVEVVGFFEGVVRQRRRLTGSGR